jgi:hypothetical protein
LCALARPNSSQDSALVGTNMHANSLQQLKYCFVM